MRPPPARNHKAAVARGHNRRTPGGVCVGVGLLLVARRLLHGGDFGGDCGGTAVHAAV